MTSIECTVTIWKTIKIGTGIKTADEFCAALKSANCCVNTWANDVLGQPAFKVSPAEAVINLVDVSVSELGFEYGATYGDICDRAVERSLNLCPAEVGPQLRLQYPNQPARERLLIAMEAIRTSKRLPSIFSLYRYFMYENCWLGADYGLLGRFWDGKDRFVFVAS